MLAFTNNNKNLCHLQYMRGDFSIQVSVDIFEAG